MDFDSIKDIAMLHWPALGSIILPNVGGWTNGIIFAGKIRREGQQSWYDELKKPSWNPPKWVFGPAWTILYSSMGYASYIVYKECGGFTDEAVLPLSLYGGQLLLNWAWTPIFFGLHDLKLAFIEIAVLSGAAVATTVSFASVNKTAGALLLPYLAWLGFASTLSYNIWKNNPKGPQVKEIKDEKAQ
ncbi:unnamed protein product [Chrysodeixis includens]|uniref:Translocator protein n=1 Tax=Chrysodeixis includens TaxID=689277 RepID=A0A9P0BXS3_CHRIL|nr:unnamed protein product [Chrysodeixis includens]